MSSSLYNHAPFHPIGAATLLVWDALAGPDDPATALPAGAWRSVGKVADAAVVMTVETAGQELALKGLSQPIARRLTAQRYSLSFRLLEVAGPEALELLFGLGSAQFAQSAEIAATTEALRLYGTDWSELAHPFGILAAAPPGVSGASASAGGSGGSIPAGTHYYWIAPVVPGDGAGLALGSAASAGSASVSSGQKVTLEFTPPASYAPKGFAVYRSSSNTLATAQLAGLESGAGGEILLSAHSGSGGYGAAALRLFSYDGATEYASGTDFTADIPKGLLRRLPGGTIPSGSRVVAVYAYARPAGVLTSLGDPVTLERYRRIKLLQLAPENGSGLPGDLEPATWRETGVEWELHRVALGTCDSSYSFTSDDFADGAAVVWDCLYDGAHARVGVVRSTFGVLATYE